MAAQLSAGQHFRFQRVQIFKTQSLGIGSYGAVYKAKCDRLPCAAKLLHPILFQDRDPGGRRVRERFEQECHFLSGIRHPNIVQYLGTCIDSESSLPVLLMELMDESLTHLLERSQHPLPFHLEVNLCHDTALALDYLHSNGIIHRDLSSNNVLLVAGSRAKITDFGMSKMLQANPRMTPFTQCPGTTAYMPPEGLRNPPVYTTKLDCFSFGVLSVQIMTRQFPNPGPEERVIEDARSPVGTIKIPITDSERRKAHIDLIDPNHTLLRPTLCCLSYSERDRPSAQELCDQLEVMKQDPRYRHSETQGQDRGQVAAQIHEIQELHQQQLQDKDAEIVACREQLREQLELLEEKDHLLIARERQVQELYHQLHAKQVVVADFQQALTEREMDIEQLREAISAREEEVTQTLEESTEQLASATPVDISKLKWRTCPKAPAEIMRGSTAVDGRTVYVAFGNSVYGYNAGDEQWSPLPQCPSQHAGLAVVNGQLTAVGGQSINWEPANTVYNLTDEGQRRMWSRDYPPMSTKRSNPAVICSGNSLVVAGGIVGSGHTLAVEVMDTTSLQWFTASSLPHYFNDASATVCGDTLYLIGGYDTPNGIDGSQSVLTCSLTALFESRTSQSLVTRVEALSTKGQPQVWKKAADVPVYFTTCTTICGQVLAVGGNLNLSFEQPNPTDNVYKYDPSQDAWTVISHLPAPRYQCLVASLPDNGILVVGGNDVNNFGTSTVEIGSVDQ